MLPDHSRIILYFVNYIVIFFQCIHINFSHAFDRFISTQCSFIIIPWKMIAISLILQILITFQNRLVLNRFWRTLLNYIRKALCIFHYFMQWNKKLQCIASRRRRKKDSKDGKILLIWSQWKDMPPLSLPPDFRAESFPSPP